ncbi:U6 snRNP-associated protein Lsm8 [Schizosaccharomyces cryophilus OY26]|uniref:LSM2-LSM8 complex subunit LSM8 n=1 Tax=Schizosaccharomyces cryophilus (strain OY26 / ATCC MYA-4695 / CBS 11777 / NBRC 106824 / NRRL Y48691) TaxID=653667 RepID=S9VZF3_SCHCR|nr:U6 snRNP-associated protein Lsm8 [Schizosaccharomyces cryophilus OY26]EPY51180.1 U6 snRNP-associated protein Lsm8 [Schizosaccharomyces cryophilus OY26]
MSLADFVEQKVQVITNDGRVVLGLLRGFDHTTNLILSDSVERIISLDQDTETIPLGVYLLRGENVAIVGLVNESLDADIDWEKIRGESIPDILH